MICYLYENPAYFFFASDLPELLYYSHIPATIIALLVGFLVFLNDRRNLLNQLLLLISLSFSCWTITNLFLWTNIRVDYLIFAWPLLAISTSLIAILTIYFVYVFVNKKELPITGKITLFLLILPVLLFAHTDLSVSGYNIVNCDAYGFEGLIFKKYYIALGIISIIYSSYIFIKGYRDTVGAKKRQILLMGAGVESFLISFLTATFGASYLAGIGLLEDSRLEFYGLFGMIIFNVFIAALIIKFNTFKTNIIAPQILVISLIIIVSSQLTYVTTKTAVILTFISVILTGVIGYILVKSVKKEISQRVKIESLAIKLEKANVRLQQVDKLKSEFVSIASHQLRSPITAISGYASLISEGTYGEMPAKMKDPMNRIVQSARMMAVSIEDYLNVSRIEAGNMKYVLTDLNLADGAEHICDDLRPEALKLNLILLFRKRLTSHGIVNADIGKVQQIIHNLINNAIKYTPKGAITIYVHDNTVTKRIYVDFMDTGIGMSQETTHSIFQKFERGDQANTVNVSGTGLGLYVAQKMAEAMGGSISAHSDGEGKGSRFTLELPLVM